MPQRGTLVAMTVLVWLFAGSAAGEPETADLANYGTREQLSDFLERLPTRCAPVSGESDLCSWYVANRQSAWESLADAIGTKRQVNAICEIPRDGAPRNEGSCTLHPRQAEPSDDRGPESVLVDLQNCSDPQCTSRYVGEAPERCALSGGAAASCEWVLNNGSRGFRKVASIADTKRRVRLRCEYPAAGSDAWSAKCKVREDGN